MAVITGVDGPSYRPVGACMAILASGARIGSLSSGCIEQDLVLHAQDVLRANEPKSVLYGRGSPFIDIQLPCGGGLEILLLPRPDKRVLAALVDRHGRREHCCLSVNPISGAVNLGGSGATGPDGDCFNIQIAPELFFYVFGKGPEASTFASLAQSAGYPNMLLSPDRETLDAVVAGGTQTYHLKRAEMPRGFEPDARSAIVLFFHDHDWEPPLLKAALSTPAFFIGAQGSQRARAARHADLDAQGVSAAALDRLRGPIGLVPSARDARTLAVSVLAEILGEANRPVI